MCNAGFVTELVAKSVQCRSACSKGIHNLLVVFDHGVHQMLLRQHLWQEA